MKILPNDILIRETSGDTTLWVSQRLVVSVCGISEDYLWKIKTIFKHSLPASWQRVIAQGDFLLGDTGKSWRWGRKGGQYYYDIDRIPNRKPCFYRDMLPSKAELIAQVDQKRLRGSRERQAEQRRMITQQVKLLIDNSDIQSYLSYKLADKGLFDLPRACELAEAAAWCRFIKEALHKKEFKQFGFNTQMDFLELCADILSASNLEGLRIRSAGSLRNKIARVPTDPEKLRSYLISGKYGNDNPRKLGKYKMVDYSTGELLNVDEHEAAIMTYWLNPGGCSKYTKRELWEKYASDMEAIGKIPVKPSTFNHYTNTWANKLWSSKERHGKDHANAKYRPYVPAKPLQLANSLWASDASGIVPYRYRDQYGKWRMMKLYVMMVSDVASRYIAGYSVSRQSSHFEDSKMLRKALQMALLNNGKTEVLDFISDNHSAYTGNESKSYLQLVFRNYRTIAPGNSQANPAEMMFRLFKRRFKSYFKLPETSWDARGLESMANPDYYNLMALPTYDEAIQKLTTAIEEWNHTPMRNEISPAQWFSERKNENAKPYNDRHYRMITGEVSKKDLSYSRSIMELERGGNRFKFDIPGDADTIAMIAKHMGYASSFKATIYWNNEGADVYSPDGVYMFTCEPAPEASKSAWESDSKSLAALGYYTRKGVEFDKLQDGFVDKVVDAREVMARNYAFHIQQSDTKEEYNAMHEQVSAAKFNKAWAKKENDDRRFAARQQAKEEKNLEQAALQYQRNRISDLSKYK